MAAIGNKRKRKPGVDVEDAEADYEKKPRVGPMVENPNERMLLPIKSANNIIQRKEKIPPEGTLLVVTNNSSKKKKKEENWER